MNKLILYSSPECCLCDEALALVKDLCAAHDIAIKKVNIFEDKSLLIKYRYSIPVVEYEATSQTLAWPFDLGKFEQWLVGCGV